MNKLLLSASVALGATSLAYAQQTEKPNFVLFIADDCSHYDLGCYGSVDSKTPNIDRFATQGVRFTQAYQAVPMSSPTRHNLYTGLWPVRSGAYPNHTCADEGTLSVVHHLQPWAISSIDREIAYRSGISISFRPLCTFFERRRFEF